MASGFEVQHLTEFLDEVYDMVIASHTSNVYDEQVGRRIHEAKPLQPPLKLPLDARTGLKVIIASRASNVYDKQVQDDSFQVFDTSTILRPP